MNKKPIQYYMDRVTHEVTPESARNWSDIHLSASIPLEQGRYFALIVMYETGDSFGRSPDPRYEVIDVYKTYDEAAAEATKVRAHADEYERRENFRYNPSEDDPPFDGLNISIRHANGEEKNMFAYWNGYFEEILSIDVIEVAIGVTKRKMKF